MPRFVVLRYDLPGEQRLTLAPMQSFAFGSSGPGRGACRIGELTVPMGTRLQSIDHGVLTVPGYGAFTLQSVVEGRLDPPGVSYQQREA